MQITSFNQQCLQLRTNTTASSYYGFHVKHACSRYLPISHGIKYPAGRIADSSKELTPHHEKFEKRWRMSCKITVFDCYNMKELIKVKNCLYRNYWRLRNRVLNILFKSGKAARKSIWKLCVKNVFYSNFFRGFVIGTLHPRLHVCLRDFISILFIKQYRHF